MALVKKYYAFISYQRSDEEWAERLRHKLEHYHLPLNLRKNHTSLPKNIRPIFRDTLELSGGVLAKEIETALEESRFLIVVCSQRSAQSPWVNKEIQTFINQGREEQIIPFIIEGTPNSGKVESECFPPALQSLRNDRELLGININELGRDAAIVKIVARMFDLHFDTLWQRFKREQKQKKSIIIGGTILFAVISLLVGAFFMRQNTIIEQQRDQLENVTIRLKEDSLALAHHITRIQNDSITLSLQKDSILKTNKLLHESNNNLAIANLNLQEANQNIKKKNYNLKVSNYSILAKRALILLDQGNAIEAENIAKQICNDNDIHQFMFMPEIESLLRRIHRHQHNSFERFKRRFILDNIGTIDLAQLSNDKNELYLMQHESFATYNTLTGEISQEIPEAYPPCSQIYYYDERTHTIIYILDNQIFFKNILTNQDIFPAITADDDINDLIIGSDMTHLAYELRKEQNTDTEEPISYSEWHLVDLSSLYLNNIIIPNCTDVFAFSPDGSQLFVDIDNCYYLYDISKHDTIAQIPYPYSIEKAHFTSDGKNLVMTHSNPWGKGKSSFIDVFNIPTNESVFGQPISSNGSIADAQENPKNNIIVIGGGMGLKLYDTEFLSHYNYVKKVQPQRFISGKLIDSIPDSNGVYSIHFNHSGSSMITTANHRLCFWDIDTMDVFDSYKAGLNRFKKLASSGKSYITETNDGYMILKDIYTNNTIGFPLYKATDYAPNGPFKRLYPLVESISRNSEVVVMRGREDSTIMVLRPILGDLYTIKHECNSYSLKLSMDKTGKYLAVLDYPSFSIHDIENKKILISHKDNIKDLEMSPSGNEFAVANSTDSITIYKVINFKKKIQISARGIYRLTYSPDGTLIAGICDENTIRIWDTRTGELVNKFMTGSKEMLDYCSVSPDNKYIIGKEFFSNLLYIWNTQTKTLVDKFSLPWQINWYLFCQDVQSKIYYKDSYGYHLMDFPTLEEIIHELK